MTESERVTLKNGVKVYPFASFDDLLEFADSRKKILVAINAEKILHATDQTKAIINGNIGYCDGTGAVMAMKSYGKRAVKIAGCELWLKIVAAKLFGARLVFIESRARVYSRSKTGRILYPFCDTFIVQWPELLYVYGDKAEYFGTFV